MLDGAAGFDEARNYDIADQWTDDKGRQRRCRSWALDRAPEGMRQVRLIDLSSEESDEPETERRQWRWYVQEDGSRTARREQEWGMHADCAEGIACDLVARLGLQEPEASATVYAAKWHDLGKRRELWQRSIGNRGYPSRVLAKSGPNTRGFFCGYRHELGSLVDISQLPEFPALTPDVQELALHVVAAHHGRARPHFDSEETFDPEFPQRAVEMAGEAPRRFARLQRKYGRWGLAYLESLVRVADALASRRVEQAGVTGGGT
jgi:CRISPR-associated endonuclease/helicase Cas3